MNYALFEHRHKFAAWTAGRASQWALASVDVHRRAIEASSIVAFLQEPDCLEIDKATFELRHREWCLSVIRYLEDYCPAKVYFGRAAKAVAVYLKAMVVVGGFADSSLAAVAHPPVDRILLQNLVAATEVQSPHKEAWRTTAWTTLEEVPYYELLAQLREVLPQNEPFWKLEFYWRFPNAASL